MPLFPQHLFDGLGNAVRIEFLLATFRLARLVLERVNIRVPNFSRWRVLFDYCTPRRVSQLGSMTIIKLAKLILTGLA